MVKSDKTVIIILLLILCRCSTNPILYILCAVCCTVCASACALCAYIIYLLCYAMIIIYFHCISHFFLLLPLSLSLSLGWMFAGWFCSVSLLASIPFIHTRLLLLLCINVFPLLFSLFATQSFFPLENMVCLPNKSYRDCYHHQHRRRRHHQRQTWITVNSDLVCKFCCCLLLLLLFCQATARQQFSSLTDNFHVGSVHFRVWVFLFEWLQNIGCLFRSKMLNCKRNEFNEKK